MLDILVTIAGIVCIFFLWRILYDSNRFVVVRHSFADPRIRKPFRAVVLADLHNKRYGRENALLLNAIHELKPDAVLVAGDMITASPGGRLDVGINCLQKLSEEYPVYYADGNHEHRLELYPEEYGSMAQDYEKALQEMGIRRLVNEHTVLKGNGIAVYGSRIDREYYRRFRVRRMEKEYLDKLLGEPSGEYYNILIAHNPDYFPQYADWGADLVLSGHVHGGLVRIPGGKGLVSPRVSFFPKYDGGIFREGKSVMLLSRGLGNHTIPIRLFNPGELLVIELFPQEGEKKEHGNSCEA